MMRYVAIIAMLVGIATCQPHDLQADDTTPPPMVPSQPAVDPASSVAPPVVSASGSTGGPSSAAPVATDTSMAPPVVVDTTTGPVVTAAPVDASSAAPAVSSSPAAPASTVVITESPATSPAVVTTPAPTVLTPANFYPNVDEIISVFKKISQSEYFTRLSYEDQLLILELTSGGEVGKINEVMDSLGHERLLTFIYNMPLKYFDDLMQFILASIQREKSLMALSS